MNNNRYVINIITQEQQTKDIFQSNIEYWGKQICCYCNDKADHGLWNGYHCHICKTKHYLTDRQPTSWICQKCFDFAVNFVNSSRLLVYRVIRRYQ